MDKVATLKKFCLPPSQSLEGIREGRPRDPTQFLCSSQTQKICTTMDDYPQIYVLTFTDCIPNLLNGYFIGLQKPKRALVTR